ncbi:MAG: carbohydrate kinase family protein [Thermodesulfobacteriota bacterium]
MQIYISGSLAYDRIMDFPGRFGDHILPEKIHILNVCFIVDGLREKFGGTAGNIAYSLALLGEHPLILSVCGVDFDRYRAWLARHGLSLEGVREIEHELTAAAFITTDKSDNQITAFHPGAMNHTSDYNFNGVPKEGALAIVSPGNLNDMYNYSRTYARRNIPYIFDPGQNTNAFSSQELIEMITGSEMLISNDYELEMIQKTTGLDRESLLEKTRAIVTTLGEHGSLVATREGLTAVPAARPDRVMDPTGAGDAYRAGLLKGLVLGWDLATAARVGSVCASFAVEQYGTQEHSFTQDEFWARYKENF